MNFVIFLFYFIFVWRVLGAPSIGTQLQLKFTTKTFTHQNSERLFLCENFFLSFSFVKRFDKHRQLVKEMVKNGGEKTKYATEI